MAQSAAKTRIAWGSMAKAETTYLTDPSLAAASDGLLLAAPPACDHGTYLYDGHRGMTPAGVPLNRAVRLGLEAKHTVTVEPMGAGAAYSASVYPDTLAFHSLLQSAGLVATGSFVGGSEKWYYAPMVGPSALVSVTMQNYVEGQMYKLYGGFSDLTIEAKGPQIPLWTFVTTGTGDEPTDVAIPSITSYPTYSLVAPEVANAAVTFGSFTAPIVKDFTFKLNRKVDSKRVNLTAAGVHYGFAPMPPTPTIELTVEKGALKTASPWTDAATMNPYQLRNTETLVYFQLNVGTTQYNRFKIFSGSTYGSSAQAQLVAVAETAEGPIGQWKLTFEFKPSTYALTDLCTIQFD